MDRNTSNEPAYRPLGDPPTAHIRSRDPASCYEESRQVLARMPNLASADADMKPMARYGHGENRVISSGLSTKVLAGVGIGLFVVAVLGFVLVRGKTTPESKDSAAWQPEPPAPGAAVAPPWASSEAQTPAWQSDTEVTASPWNGPSPTPAWNAPSSTTIGGDPASAPPSGSQSWQGANQLPAAADPTELTATGAASAEPVWGQAQGPGAATPAANNPPFATAWNSSPPTAPPDASSSTSRPADATSTPGWPGVPQTSPATPSVPQTAATNPPANSATESAQANAWNSPVGGYEAARPAPAYAGAYQQPQAAVNRSMGLTDPSNVQPSDSQLSGTPPAAGYVDNRRPYTVGSEPRFDPRAGYGNETRTAAQPAYSPTTPGSTAPDYRTADRRQGYSWDNRTTESKPSGSDLNSYPGVNGQPSYTAGGASASSPNYPLTTGSSNPPTANNPANSYPNGSYPASSYPPNNYPASNPPSNSTPASGYPASSYPSSGLPTSNYPTSSYPASSLPTSSYPTSGYPTSNLPASNFSPNSGSAGSYPAGSYPANGYQGSYPAASYPTGSYPAAGSAASATAGESGSSYLPQYNAGASGSYYTPQYNAGASTVPQAGGAQFEGRIEKPTTARASYDSTRPGLY